MHTDDLFSGTRLNFLVLFSLSLLRLGGKSIFNPNQLLRMQKLAQLIWNPSLHQILITRAKIILLSLNQTRILYSMCTNPSYCLLQSLWEAIWNFLSSIIQTQTLTITQLYMLLQLLIYTRTSRYGRSFVQHQWTGSASFKIGALGKIDRGAELVMLKWAIKKGSRRCYVLTRFTPP